MVAATQVPQPGLINQGASPTIRTANSQTPAAPVPVASPPKSHMVYVYAGVAGVGAAVLAAAGMAVLYVRSSRRQAAARQALEDDPCAVARASEPCRYPCSLEAIPEVTASATQALQGTDAARRAKETSMHGMVDPWVYHNPLFAIGGDTPEADSTCSTETSEHGITSSSQVAP